MSKFLFYFLFFSLNCKAPLNHWEMALNKFIIIIISNLFKKVRKTKITLIAESNN